MGSIDSELKARLLKRESSKLTGSRWTPKLVVARGDVYVVAHLLPCFGHAHQRASARTRIQYFKTGQTKRPAKSFLLSKCSLHQSHEQAAQRVFQLTVLEGDRKDYSLDLQCRDDAELAAWMTYLREHVRQHDESTGPGAQPPNKPAPTQGPSTTLVSTLSVPAPASREEASSPTPPMSVPPAPLPTPASASSLAIEAASETTNLKPQEMQRSVELEAPRVSRPDTQPAVSDSQEHEGLLNLMLSPEPKLNIIHLHKPRPCWTTAMDLT